MYLCTVLFTVSIYLIYLAQPSHTHAHNTAAFTSDRISSNSPCLAFSNRRNGFPMLTCPAAITGVGILISQSSHRAGRAAPCLQSQTITRPCQCNVCPYVTAVSYLMTLDLCVTYLASTYKCK
ncbi:hypothetical protein LZ31DRAFT_235179 [Colletotrichum somersetense]|nr:hypothetical protein LZ31DRAFT_235179 [Colletotrichum somersetense]